MIDSVNVLFEKCDEIEEKLGYRFHDKNLLLLAFVHRSFINENRHLVENHNERLELLGDCVLNLIVSDYLYRKLPKHSEGHLSLVRSHIVEAKCCSDFALKLDVKEFILLGKGEQMNAGKGRETIHADFFEAVIGAIYLDGGLDAAREFFLLHFQEEMQEFLEKPLRNSKAMLQDYAQKKYQKPPVYKVLSEEGPEHNKVFFICAYVEEKEVGQGKGCSKKEAEQAAADDALNRLKL